MWSALMFCRDGRARRGAGRAVAGQRRSRLAANEQHLGRRLGEHECAVRLCQLPLCARPGRRGGPPAPCSGILRLLLLTFNMKSAEVGTAVEVSRSRLRLTWRTAVGAMQVTAFNVLNGSATGMLPTRVQVRCARDACPQQPPFGSFPLRFRFLFCSIADRTSFLAVLPCRSSSAHKNVVAIIYIDCRGISGLVHAHRLLEHRIDNMPVITCSSPCTTSHRRQGSRRRLPTKAW